ncbi:hypothetical protein IT396_00175 [Candidatus Nomurabacteria bacterium]|nr:hypothetical protein [Candidatus Nomurabacteria bacterium]
MKKGHSLAICGPPIDQLGESSKSYSIDNIIALQIGAGFGGQASVQDVAALT